MHKPTLHHWHQGHLDAVAVNNCRHQRASKLLKQRANDPQVLFSSSCQSVCSSVLSSAALLFLCWIIRLTFFFSPLLSFMFFSFWFNQTHQLASKTVQESQWSTMDKHVKSIFRLTLSCIIVGMIQFVLSSCINVTSVIPLHYFLATASSWFYQGLHHLKYRQEIYIQFFSEILKLCTKRLSLDRNFSSLIII